MDVRTRLLNADELWRFGDEECRMDLIRGELVREPLAGFGHGAIIVRLASRLEQHVRAHDLGIVLAAETGFKLSSDPDTVLGPDVAFVRKDRLPDPLPKKFFNGPPDLAVEVLSPSQTIKWMDRKVQEYLDAGTRLVWVMDTERQRALVYRPGGQVTIVDKNDTLDGEDVVPGFRLAIAILFD